MSDVVLRFRPAPGAGDPSPALYKAAVIAALTEIGLIPEDLTLNTETDIDRYKRLGAPWDLIEERL